MMTTNVKALDRTMHQTQEWIRDIAGRLGSDDPEKGYIALRAVLHTLRDRLPPDEAVDLSAQMPTLVRGIYFEGWHPADKPLKYRHREEFLNRVLDDAPALAGHEVEDAVSAVFEELSSELDPGEVDEVRDAMPAEVRQLWPSL